MVPLKAHKDQTNIYKILLLQIFYFHILLGADHECRTSREPQRPWPKSLKNTSIQSQPLRAVLGDPTKEAGCRSEYSTFFFFFLNTQLNFLNKINLTFLQIPAQAKCSHWTRAHSWLMQCSWNYSKLITERLGQHSISSVCKKPSSHWTQRHLALLRCAA